MKKVIGLFALIVFLASCGKSPKKQEPESSKITKEISLEPAWSSDTLLRTPESVIYDSKREFIYVSNINENPWEKDENGFISRMGTDGKIVDLFWVEGLSGPKGMAVFGDVLYVADIDELVEISIITGEINRKIKVENASGLNDITIDKNGKVYMSDSGGGAIYSFYNNTVETVLNGLEGRPNGLRILDGDLFILFSSGSRLIKYNLEGKTQIEMTKDVGHGDGIMETNVPGNFLITDWEGQIFYYSAQEGLTTLSDTRESKIYSADLWFIKEISMVFVPTFFDNRVLAYKLIE